MSDGLVVLIAFVVGLVCGRIAHFSNGGEWVTIVKDYSDEQNKGPFVPVSYRVDSIISVQIQKISMPDWQSIGCHIQTIDVGRVRNHSPGESFCITPASLAELKRVIPNLLARNKSTKEVEAA